MAIDLPRNTVTINFGYHPSYLTYDDNKQDKESEKQADLLDTFDDLALFQHIWELDRIVISQGSVLYPVLSPKSSDVECIDHPPPNVWGHFALMVYWCYDFQEHVVDPMSLKRTSRKDDMQLSSPWVL